MIQIQIKLKKELVLITKESDEVKNVNIDPYTVIPTMIKIS